MKSHVVLSLLAVTCMSGVVQSKLEKRRLNFSLDCQRRITGYSAQSMNFLVDPEQCLGRDIVTVIPLSDDDRNKLIQGYTIAREQNKQVKVPYSLCNIPFLAKITPLTGGLEGFFVEVQESPDNLEDMPTIEE